MPSKSAGSLALVVAGLAVGMCVLLGISAAQLSRTQFLSEPPNGIPAVIGGLLLAAVGYADKWLDGSAATVVRRRCTRPRCASAARSRCRVAPGSETVTTSRVDPWTAGETEPVRLWVSIEQIRELREGRRVHVHVHPGALGYPWIERGGRDCAAGSRVAGADRGRKRRRGHAQAAGRGGRVDLQRARSPRRPLAESRVGVVEAAQRRRSFIDA